MVHRRLDSFSGKKIAMLQGSIKSFFKNLACDFKNIGATVYKINFNGDDLFLSSFQEIKKIYRKAGRMATFFTDLIEKNAVDTAILFGDCRIKISGDSDSKSFFFCSFYNIMPIQTISAIQFLIMPPFLLQTF